MAVIHTKCGLVYCCTLLLLLCVQSVQMFCPYGCGCDEQKGVVTCIRADLEVQYSFE